MQLRKLKVNVLTEKKLPEWKSSSNRFKIVHCLFSRCSFQTLSQCVAPKNNPYLPTETIFVRLITSQEIPIKVIPLK